MSSESATIDFYGASWCGDCRRAQALLEHYGVDFTYHDIDASDNDKNTAIQLSGRPNIPVLRVPDGSVLTEPSNPLLNEKLTELGVARLVPLVTERGVAEATSAALAKAGELFQVRTDSTSAPEYGGRSLIVP